MRSVPTQGRCGVCSGLPPLPPLTRCPMHGLGHATARLSVRLSGACVRSPSVCVQVLRAAASTRVTGHASRVMVDALTVVRYGLSCRCRWCAGGDGSLTVWCLAGQLLPGMPVVLGFDWREVVSVVVDGDSVEVTDDRGMVWEMSADTVVDID